MRYWAPNPLTSVPGVGPPRDYTVRWTAMFTCDCPVIAQGNHSTGLRGRTLGVSASAGIKAEIYRCVWGRLGGSWGWHSGLDWHML